MPFAPVLFRRRSASTRRGRPHATREPRAALLSRFPRELLHVHAHAPTLHDERQAPERPGGGTGENFPVSRIDAAVTWAQECLPLRAPRHATAEVRARGRERGEPPRGRRVAHDEDAFPHAARHVGVLHDAVQDDFPGTGRPLACGVESRGWSEIEAHPAARTCRNRSRDESREYGRESRRDRAGGAAGDEDEEPPPRGIFRTIRRVHRPLASHAISIVARLRSGRVWLQSPEAEAGPGSSTTN